MALVLLLILHTRPTLVLPQLNQMLCQKSAVSLAGLATSFHLGIAFFFLTRGIHLLFADRQHLIDLGWRDLANRKMDTLLTLFYKTVNHDVNVNSEGILTLVKGDTRKSQGYNKHDKCMHIGSNIDDYKYP